MSDVAHTQGMQLTAPHNDSADAVSWVSMMLDMDAGEEEENLLWQCASAKAQVHICNIF